MTRISLALLALLTAIPLFAQDEYTRDWRGLDSDHFHLVGNANAGAMRRVGERLEEFRADVLAVMPQMAETWQTETTVIVFRHDAAFEPFRPDGNVAGYFTSGPYRNYIALTGERGLEQTIYHEYVHQLTKERREWPTWLNEGIAEFYSTLERTGRDRILIGRGIGSHVEWLQRVVIPLEEFLDPETEYYGDESRTRSLYAQGWALVHYLHLKRPDGIPQLNEFIRLMAVSGNDVRTSVEGAFGVDVPTLEDEFVGYMRNSLTVPALEVRFPERLPEIELPDTYDVSESEASFYLGDLLVHLGDDAQARAYLDRALELGGDYAPALTSLYQLSARQGGNDEARAFLDRAVRRPEAGWLPHLLTAREAILSGRYPAVAEEAEAELRGVVRDQPALPDGHFWLGQLLMQQPAALDEAIAELERAVVLSGGDPSMRIVHARAVANSGDDQGANQLIAAVLRATTDPYVRDQANQLQEDIRERAEARAAAAARRPPPREVPNPPDGGDGGRSREEPTLRRSDESPAPPPPANAGAIPRPILPEGMAMVEGSIVFIGCIDVFELEVVSADGTIRLSAPDLSNVELVSYSTAVQGEMPCGEMNPPLPARVIYRPADGADAQGEPLRVDFLP